MQKEARYNIRATGSDDVLRLTLQFLSLEQALEFISMMNGRNNSGNIRLKENTDAEMRQS